MKETWLVTHPPSWLATAIEIVHRAGRIQLEHFGQDLQVRKKGKIDIVTKADIDIERMGRALIADRFPDHGVLAEELENQDAETAVSHRWVFDPLDGTVNYAHGVPIFCSCLALEVEGRPEVAAVFDPTRSELFTAERGGGARLNGSLISVSTTECVNDALLCTGFPYDIHETVHEMLGLFGAMLGRARAVRRLGSAALDLCYVAASRFDGFWEQRLQPWDMSAASLVVEEAGGCLSRFDGGSFGTHSDQIVATNGRIHDEMIEIINAQR